MGLRLTEGISRDRFAAAGRLCLNEVTKQLLA